MSHPLLSRSQVTEGDLGGGRRLVEPFAQLSKNELWVLRWLLWRYNPKNGECKPSDEDIAAGTGLSEKSCTRARKALKARGLIDWSERRIGGKRTSNEYVILLTDTLSPGEPHGSLGGPSPGDTLSPLRDTLSPTNGQTSTSLTDKVSEEVKGLEGLKVEEEGEEDGPPPNPPRGDSVQGQDNRDQPPCPATTNNGGVGAEETSEAEQRVILADLEARLPSSKGSMREANERAISQLRDELEEVIA